MLLCGTLLSFLTGCPASTLICETRKATLFPSWLDGGKRRGMVHKLAPVVLLVLLLTVLTGFASAQTAAPQPFRMLASQANLDIGAAVALQPLLNDPQYVATLIREFNLIVPENALKFAVLSSAPGQYNFSGADYIVDFARANNMKVFGHVLVWHDRIPAWVLNGGYNRDQLLTILRNHITTVVTRYRGKIAYWDVVNEAVNPTGGYRASLWYTTIGADYIETAFRTAHEADPNALLFYNDYSNEGLTAKSDFIYNMVKDLKARGVPIDGVGFHMHQRLDFPPDMAKMRQNIARLEALGLQVRITEMDVQINVSTAPLADRLNQQAKFFGDALSTCLSFSVCTGFTSWGFTDKYTWRSPDTPLMFDSAYQPKPAYFAMNNAFVSYLANLGKVVPEPTVPSLVIQTIGRPVPGQVLTVAFKLYRVAGLYGLETRCQIPPPAVSSGGYTDGDLFTGGNSFVVNGGYNPAAGSWDIAASRLRPNPAISGSGTAFTLRFTLAQATIPVLTCTALAVDAEGRVLPLAVMTLSG